VPASVLQALPARKRGCPYLVPGRGGRRLSGQAVLDTVVRVAERAGVEPAPRPHALRRTFARALYEDGLSLWDLSQLLGHADPATTAKYIGAGWDVTRLALNGALRYLQPKSKGG